MCNELIFDKVARAFQWRKYFQQTVPEELGSHNLKKKMNLNPYLTPYTKINLKIKANKSMKLSEENKGKNISDLRVG